jgi:hypothetical protein
LSSSDGILYQDAGDDAGNKFVERAKSDEQDSAAGMMQKNMHCAGDDDDNDVLVNNDGDYDDGQLDNNQENGSDTQLSPPASQAISGFRKRIALGGCSNIPSVLETCNAAPEMSQRDAEEYLEKHVTEHDMTCYREWKKGKLFYGSRHRTPPSLAVHLHAVSTIAGGEYIERESINFSAAIRNWFHSVRRLVQKELPVGEEIDWSEKEKHTAHAWAILLGDEGKCYKLRRNGEAQECGSRADDDDRVWLVRYKTHRARGKVTCSSRVCSMYCRKPFLLGPEQLLTHLC